jgi:hypothetical protein
MIDLIKVAYLKRKIIKMVNNLGFKPAKNVVLSTM